MTKLERVENSAILIMSDIAFVYEMENNIKVLRAYDLKDLRKRAMFAVCKGEKIRMVESSLSELKNYKAMLFAERNNQLLLRGYAKWESM